MRDEWRVSGHRHLISTSTREGRRGERERLTESETDGHRGERHIGLEQSRERGICAHAHRVGAAPAQSQTRCICIDSINTSRSSRTTHGRREAISQHRFTGRQTLRHEVTRGLGGLCTSRKAPACSTRLFSLYCVLSSLECGVVVVARGTVRAAVENSR